MCECALLSLRGGNVPPDPDFVEGAVRPRSPTSACVNVRLLVRGRRISDPRLYCWGGGGIVSDSDPAQEYVETLNKIELLLNTLISEFGG